MSAPSNAAPSNTAPSNTVAARALRWGPLAVFLILLIVLPLQLDKVWVNKITLWIPLAVAALGLNLLTGYNGQISIGHGALCGFGAYATALMINEWELPFLVAILLGSVFCFAVGVAIGLPALRIKGLYLALVTLSFATLFPQLIEQFSSFTGGTTGLAVTSPQEFRGAIRDREIKFQAPEWSGLADDQWRYFLFLALAAGCFVIVANVARSRVGRSLVAIRDNEVAAEVSGVNVATAKVFTFGISAALAGISGGMIAVYNARVTSGSFGLALSLAILVAVVLGGSATTMGPALGAISVSVFETVIKPELPKDFLGSIDLQPATPLILGVLLIISVLVAPGGTVGSWHHLLERLSHRSPSPTEAPNPSE